MPRICCVLLILVPLLAACGRGEVVQPNTPTAYVSERSATATAETLRSTETAANPTQEADAPAVSGDPARGQELFTTFQAEANFACNTCHLTDSEAMLIGPGLQHVGTRAATRVEGQSAVDYIHNSIVNPSDFVVPTYPDNLMPHVYGTIFSEDQINDLIAYLMTL